MKLQSMNTDQLLDTLCCLTPTLCRLACDSRTADALDELADADLAALPALEAAALLASTLIPLLLQTHREDTLTVLSILTDKPLHTLRAQCGLDTIRDACDCLDEVLLHFFACAAGTKQGLS